MTVLDMLVAKTILQQLGGNRFIMMTGARNLTGHADALTFKLPRAAKNGANYCKIQLDPSDTYNVEFWFVRGLKMTFKGSFTDIYNDQLRDLFTRETGLETSLGTMGR
jgi:hypothetical protein